MKRAAFYMRVSTLDQHPETQLLDLRQMAAQRGYEIVQEYTDRISTLRAQFGRGWEISRLIPLGGRRQSPAPGSHRTQRADFPHWARQTLIHSMAIACSSL
jgi:hypothetical protein